LYVLKLRTAWGGQVHSRSSTLSSFNGAHDYSRSTVTTSCTVSVKIIECEISLVSDIAIVQRWLCTTVFWRNGRTNETPGYTARKGPSRTAKKLPTTMITDYNYYNAFVINLNHWYAQSTLRLNRARVKMQVRVG